MARLRTPFATFLIAIPLVSLSHAQAREAQKPSQNSKIEASIPSRDLVLRLDVRRVPVDVVVLDKIGNPVRDLKLEDFTVKEDQNPQQILSFDFLDGSVPSYIPPKIPPLPPNTFINVPAGPERGPLYVLYYDMVNTEPEDQLTFRQELLHFVDRVQPGTRIALFVNASGLHLLQGFTSDHAQMRSAILTKGPGPHIPEAFLFGRNFGKDDVGATVSNLQFMAEYLTGISGRKNLIWLSGKFPIPHGPVLRSTSGEDRSARNSVKHAFAAMMRAQVAIYPVDVKGVVLWEERSSSPAGDAGPDFSTINGRSSASGPPTPVVGNGPTSGGGGASGGGSAGSQSGTPDSIAASQGMTTGLVGYSVTYVDETQEEYIASSTGGHAYYGDNRVSSVMEKAVETGESYYTLSYAPSNTNYDGSDRHIEVVLRGAKEKGYRLSYRNLYYAVSDDAQGSIHKAGSPQARFIAAKSGDNLYANIEHGAPILHELLFSAHLTADGSPMLATAEQMVQLVDSPVFLKTRNASTPQKPPAPVRLQKYVIDYGVFDPQLRALAARSNKPAILEFAAAAYDPDGRLLNSILNEGLVSAETQSTGKSGTVFHAVQELNVPQGANWIRLAVRDKQDNRTGTLEVHLPLEAQTVSTVATKVDQ